MELLRVCLDVLRRDLVVWLMAGGFVVGVEVALDLIPAFLFPVLDGAALDPSLLFQEQGQYKVETRIFGYAMLPVTVFLRLGMARMGLAAVRGQAVTLGTLFSGVRWLPSALVSYVVAMLGAALGTCMLVVPGIMFVLGTVLNLQVIVDRNVGGIQALSESWELTNYSKMTMFLSWWVVGGFLLVGSVLTLGLGLLTVYPILVICEALIYEAMRAYKEA